MPPGDHLKVRRHGILYAHHGIDLGDGTVVHFAEPFQSGGHGPGKLRRTSMADFLKGGTPLLVEYSPKNSLSAAETCRRALQSLDSGRPYSLAFNNCEHFARWCKTDKRRSGQVWRAALGMAGAGLVVVAGVGLRVIQKRRDRPNT